MRFFCGCISAFLLGTFGGGASLWTSGRLSVKKNLSEFAESLKEEFVFHELFFAQLRLTAKDVSVCDRYLSTRCIRDSRNLVLLIKLNFGTGINAPSWCGYASRVHPCTLVA